nr:MAG TPA: hypothetical protein [Caudoviricetes sp.]DAM12513.1 MAG TPA: hypothetical protein [Caudoviricetes sp.]
MRCKGTLFCEYCKFLYHLFSLPMYKRLICYIKSND